MRRHRRFLNPFHQNVSILDILQKYFWANKLFDNGWSHFKWDEIRPCLKSLCIRRELKINSRINCVGKCKLVSYHTLKFIKIDIWSHYIFIIIFLHNWKVSRVMFFGFLLAMKKTFCDIEQMVNHHYAAGMQFEHQFLVS